MQEMQEMWVQSLSQEYLLEKEMEEPGKLQTVGLQKVRQSLSEHTHMSDKSTA